MRPEPSRGLSERIETARKRISAAFRFDSEQTPIIANTCPYWLFGWNEDEIPADYCGPDPAVMTSFQTRGIEEHFDMVEDDYVPYLMPWYGTAVLASAFGCPVKFEDKADPALAGQVIESIDEIGALPIPDPTRSGLMPRVLETIDFMRENSGIPVGVTDCQGPLTTAVSLCGYDRFFYWMYDHPRAVRELLSRVTDALIHWVSVQKEHSREGRTECAGALGVWLPYGLGVWMSDDDAVLVSPEHYEEFVVPCNSRVLKAFGGGVIHFCGNASHQAENFLRTDGLKGLNVFCMGDFAGLRRLADLVEKRICIIMGDYTPADIPTYYRNLVKSLPKTGVVYAPVMTTGVALQNGKPMPMRRPMDDLAVRVRESLREQLGIITDTRY